MAAADIFDAPKKPATDMDSSFLAAARLWASTGGITFRSSRRSVDLVHAAGGAPPSASRAAVSTYLQRIQRPGLVQNFGCLLAIPGDGKSFDLVAFSENAGQMILNESPPAPAAAVPSTAAGAGASAAGASAADAGAADIDGAGSAAAAVIGRSQTIPEGAELAPTAEAIRRGEAGAAAGGAAAGGGERRRLVKMASEGSTLLKPLNFLERIRWAIFRSNSRGRGKGARRSRRLSANAAGPVSSAPAAGGAAGRASSDAIGGEVGAGRDGSGGGGAGGGGRGGGGAASVSDSAIMVGRGLEEAAVRTLGEGARANAQGKGAPASAQGEASAVPGEAEDAVAPLPQTKIALGMDVRSLFTPESVEALEKAVAADDIASMNPVLLQCRRTNRPFYAVLHRTSAAADVADTANTSGTSSTSGSSSTIPTSLTSSSILTLPGTASPSSPVATLSPAIPAVATTTSASTATAAPSPAAATTTNPEGNLISIDLEPITPLDPAVDGAGAPLTHRLALSAVKRLQKVAPGNISALCRVVVEEAFGLQLSVELEIAAQLHEKQILQIQSLLCDTLLTDNPIRALVSSAPNIMDLLPCDGAAVLFRGELSRLGVCPSEDMIIELVRWLQREHCGSSGLSTDSLKAAGFPYADTLGVDVCGMVVVCFSPADEQQQQQERQGQGQQGQGQQGREAASPVPPSPSGSTASGGGGGWGGASGSFSNVSGVTGDYLFWFRSHVEKSIKWSGARHDSRDADDARQRHPRASFKAFLEVVRHTALPWVDVEVDAVHSLQDLLCKSVRRKESMGRLISMGKQVNAGGRAGGLAGRAAENLGLFAAGDEHPRSPLIIPFCPFASPFTALPLPQNNSELAVAADELVRLIETASAPILAVDLEGNITGWNGKVAAITGLSFSDAIGQSLLDTCLDPSCVDKTRTAFELALAGEEQQQLELKLKRWGSVPKGKGPPTPFAILHVNTFVSRDSEKSIVGVCFVGQDVTEETAVRTRFVRIQGDFTTIINTHNSLMPPIFATNASGFCTEWNPAMESITGLKRSQVLGCMLPGIIFGRMCQLADDDSLTRLLIMLSRAMAGQDTGGEEKTHFAFRNAKGRMVEVLLTVQQRQGGDGRAAGAFGFLHVASPELMQALAVQQKAEGAMAGAVHGMVHARSLLHRSLLDASPSSPSAHAAPSAAAPGGKVWQFVEAMARCDAQLMRLLHTQMDPLGGGEGSGGGSDAAVFSHPSMLPFTPSAPFTMASLINTAVCQAMQHAIRRSIDLTYDALPDVASTRLVGNQLLLQQVLGGITVAAVKSTPSGGTVRLQLAPSPSRMLAVEIELRIIQSGPGIDDAIIQHMFGLASCPEDSPEASYQAHALVSYRSLLRQMHGDVHYLRQPNKCYFQMHGDVHYLRQPNKCYFQVSLEPPCAPHSWVVTGVVRCSFRRYESFLLRQTHGDVHHLQQQHECYFQVLLELPCAPSLRLPALHAEVPLAGPRQYLSPLSHSLQCRRDGCVPVAAAGAGRFGKDPATVRDTGSKLTDKLTDSILGRETEKVRDLFNFGRELGRGQFGVTYICTEKRTSLQYACKLISKKQLLTSDDVEDIKREIAILHLLSDHPNVINLKGAYEDNSAVYLVMELCTGGELFDHIIARGHYSERAAAEVVRVIVSVVRYCHANYVIHRDLKPENFLVSSEEEGAPLKAVDFGLSAFYRPGHPLHTVAGSAFYMAPEVIRGSYGPEADLWSAGVVLYILLSGSPPFWADFFSLTLPAFILSPLSPDSFSHNRTPLPSFPLLPPPSRLPSLRFPLPPHPVPPFPPRRDKRGIFEEILWGHVDQSEEPWPQVSSEAKELVLSLLQQQPERRPTAAQLMEHPWVREGGVATDTPLAPAVITRLKRFAAMNRLKRLTLKLMASHVTDAEAMGLREMFKAMDGDGSGTISSAELRDGVERLGDSVPKEQLRQMMAAADVDSSGSIDYNEFLAATMRVSRETREAHLQQAFAHFDTDGNGFITGDELRSALEREAGSAGVGEAEMERIFADVDSDQNGKIDFSEFCAMMEETTTKIEQAAKLRRGALTTNTSGQHPQKSDIKSNDSGRRTQNSGRRSAKGKKRARGSKS
ncbi:unnamed protein product [Closterium sp. Yama58-4]|nr:unnamed protein product [Closterium sp. Yama58-4]